MNLVKIQDMESVSEIYEYIVEESCEWSNTNKNLNIQDWNSIEDRIYLTNKVINKSYIESSLDLLILSNCRNFKNIHMQNLDVEDSISQARCSIFFLMCEYFQGKYDNEIEREFGFRIEGDIEQFKKLFLPENVDKFCSYLLIKSQQLERKSLSNRVVEYQKIDGKWKSISRYLSISEKSWEQALEDEDKQSVESFLYKINQIENEQHEVEIYKQDTIYSQMVQLIPSLTEKQKIFFYSILDNEDVTSFEEYLKSDDEDMNRQCKASYCKNIIKRLSKELDNCNNVKNNGYYSLIKTDNHRFIMGLKKQKDNKAKMEWICNAIKKSDTRAREIIEVLIDENVLNYFHDYIFSRVNSNCTFLYRNCKIYSFCSSKIK